eukprot:9828432-Alexandrium_andersonii.AAC.1
MLETSEISGMITDGEITVDELSTIWTGLPSQGGFIDALAFNDFIHQIDELFEYESALPSRCSYPPPTPPIAITP